jgi:hypothetical protein
MEQKMDMDTTICRLAIGQTGTKPRAAAQRIAGKVVGQNIISLADKKLIL